MWANLVGRMPEFMVIICTLLAFVIPYLVYKLNKRLHKYGDPPWKKTITDTSIMKKGKKEKKKK
ncbi:hypothetical protein CFK37_02805 [Virgibacillus phasianinus]|uniref:Uncharacterized protein n=1 Tax=Virgibacillus phasianinus TaxID=2017483 RepID=A0A220TZV0_9BACI|nr:hypothetical protein [Virgibacillus phasianinus]ASK61196.1 hypothetical protein CFK37_02805 [Virgibacillus phasianinus]